VHCGFGFHEVQGTNINAFVDEARVELYSDAVRSLVPACVGVLTYVLRGQA
jgi:hypothetical protein